MKSSCNQIAGQNKEWLAALSESIFAVAMTLLLLELRVPAGLPITKLGYAIGLPFGRAK